MDNNRVKEEYRQHTIVAAWNAGKFRGRVWKDKAIIHNTEGTDIADTVKRLKQFIDGQINVAAREAGSTPNDILVLEGFRSIMGKLHDGQFAMLKAHYHAENQTLTPRGLADAAGYNDIGAVNLHYGAVGKALYEFAPIKLQTRDDGTPIYTCYLADPEHTSESENLWQWKLRPEVAKAIEMLGLDA